MRSSLAIERADAWDHLARPFDPVAIFDPADVTDLPPAARRFLTYSIAPGAPLTATVLLDMEGLIKLERWMPFHARQVLRARDGFVWEASVGDQPFVFRGGDSYRQGRGALEFRLWGLLPVARGVGADIDRSAAGRLAAETVAWAPQALTPQMGAVWAGIDDTYATVTVPVGDDAVDVTVGVDRAGRLRELTMQRWGNPDGGDFGFHSFGGDIDARQEFSGVTIATSGRVWWGSGTEDHANGTFFRYRITRASHPVAASRRAHTAV